MSIKRLGRGFVGAGALGLLWLGPLLVGGCGSTGSDGGTHAGSGGETAPEPGQAGMAGGDASEGGASEGGSAGEAPTGPTGPTGDAGAGDTGNAGAGAVLDAPWDEHSQHVELDCFAFARGSMLFSADRAELSAQQLHLLAGLRQVRPNEQCSSDELGCGFAITSDSGTVTQYAADERDAFCDLSTPALSYASVGPWLEAIDCKFALEERAALLAASTGCFHGFHANTAASVIHQPVSLSEANRSYHFEVVHCLSGAVSLELLGADPSLPLAVGVPVANPGPRGACVAFDVAVHTPITADLVITTTALADAADYYLNFR